MKIVAIIPIKKKSKRVKGKNFKIVGGKPLYRHLLDKLKKTNFNEIYIDSDSKEIENYCKKKGYNFIKRLLRLAKDDANGNDLLNYHKKVIKADIYFQLFITAPLLSVKTINNCINIMKRNKHYDSILTVENIYSWFWFNKKPVNYKPKILPRSQDAQPVLKETTGLYGIKKNALKREKCRIGKNPHFYHVNDKEALDLDTSRDFKILKIYLKK
tara:strand:- start:8821 stop:9462 length:642 start_codon:yes stop_codon:yes gene_type:complete